MAGPEESRMSLGSPHCGLWPARGAPAILAARMTAQPQERDDQTLLDINRSFYDALWARSRVMPANRFNTWPLVESLLPASASRLEVAPGLRPRLPLEGTTFLDASEPAIAKLRERGADARLGLVSRLPFPDASFDLVAALDIVE